jgi:hypothetical protein
VPVGDQEHSGVAVAPAALLGRGDQALDLIERKVLPRAQGSIWAAPGHARRNCLFFGGWHDQAQVRASSLGNSPRSGRSNASAQTRLELVA